MVFQFFLLLIYSSTIGRDRPSYHKGRTERNRNKEMGEGERRTEKGINWFNKVEAEGEDVEFHTYTDIHAADPGLEPNRNNL